MRLGERLFGRARRHSTRYLLSLLLVISCALPVWAANTCTNFIVDGSFSDVNAPTGFPSWIQTSTNFGSPLCDVRTCLPANVTFLPRSPSWWAWFGPGLFPPELATLEQGITIPVGIAQLQFYLWNKSPLGTVTDTLKVRMDNGPIPLFSTSAIDTNYNAGYTLVTVDLSPYADGKLHQLLFEAQIDIDANFHVDDIARAQNEIFINYDPASKKIIHKNDQLQLVIDNTLLNQEIRGQAFTGSEDITVNLQNASGVLTLRGGFDCDLGNNTGGLTSARSLTVTSGNVIAENIVTRTPVGALFPGLLIKSGKFVAKNVVLRQI